MRITIFVLIAAVLLSFMLNAEAQTRYGSILEMHTAGPIKALQTENNPATAIAFICYSRLQPNLPVPMTLQNGLPVVEWMTSTSIALNDLIAGHRFLLSETSVQEFAGPVLGGRSQPQNLLESLKTMMGRQSIFLSLSQHIPSQTGLAAIFRIKQQDKDDQANCRIEETLEYLCIEAIPQS